MKYNQLAKLGRNELTDFDDVIIPFIRLPNTLLLLVTGNNLFVALLKYSEVFIRVLLTIVEFLPIAEFCVVFVTFVGIIGLESMKVLGVDFVILFMILLAKFASF